MPFNKCHRCAGDGESITVVTKFASRECGHVYCKRCGITHDGDVDKISTASLTAEDISLLSSEEEYRKLFVETSTVRNEAGEDYSRFKWKDQETLRKGVTMHVTQAIIKNSSLTDCLDILDIGCGSGFTSVVIADTLPAANVTSVDPSPQVLGVNGYAGRVKAHQGTVQALDGELGQYDVVVIIGNLMLHDDPFDTLRCAEQHLREGGLLIFDFKNIKSSARQIGILAARLGLERFFPPALFSRNFVNMRFGLNEIFVDDGISTLPLKKIGRRTKAPRLLEFANRSNYTSGWKGMIWRALDKVDRLTGQQAWLQLEYRKERR